MYQVSLREANQHLSKYIDAVTKGDEVIITKRGQPIAKLSAIPKTRHLSQKQQQIWKHLLGQLKKGYPLGGKKFDREAAHER